MTTHWPTVNSVHDSIAILVSGGLDSAVLTGQALDYYARVHPIYVRTGSAWDNIELAYLKRFLSAIARPNLRPLLELEMPMGDVYAQHWSVTGQNVPGYESADDAVFLPGRNMILLTKALIYCHMNHIPYIAMAPLDANPFPDATPEFYAAMASVANMALPGTTSILTPYRYYEKSAVIALGQAMPLQHTFSCINPIDGLHCGACNKCAERQKSFAQVGIADPTVYATANVLN